MFGLRSNVVVAMATATLVSGCAMVDPVASETLIGTWNRVGGELRCQQYLANGVFKQWWRTGDGDGTQYQAGTWTVNEGRIEIAILDGDGTGAGASTSTFFTIESLSYGSMALKTDDGSASSYERASLGVDGPCKP